MTNTFTNEGKQQSGREYDVICTSLPEVNKMQPTPVYCFAQGKILQKTKKQKCKTPV